MIEISKKYKTKSGLDVKIYDILSDGCDYNTLGVIITDGGGHIFCKWNSNTHDSWASPDDNLVEVKNFQTNSVYDECKVVAYFGHKVFVPDGYQYLATDTDGGLFAHEFIPHMRSSDWDNDGVVAFICNVKYSGDWKDSLMKI